MSLTVGNHSSAASGSSSSLSTPGITTTAGSGLVLGLTYNGGTITSVTDNKGNAAPTQIGTELGTTQKSRFYYIPNLTSAGAGHTFTVNLSAASFITLYVQEVLANNANGILLDQVNGAQDASSPYGDSSTITTTIANEMLVSVGHWQAGGLASPDTWTAGASFTMQENQTNVASIISGALGTRIVSATGTYNASWTMTQATAAHVHIGSFSEGGANMRSLLGVGGMIRVVALASLAHPQTRRDLFKSLAACLVGPKGR